MKWISSALLAVLVMSGCGAQQGQDPQAASSQTESSPDQAPPPPMTCENFAGHAEDRVKEPTSGAASAEELAESFTMNGQTVQVVSDGDSAATVYVVNEAGDSTLAQLIAFKGSGGWYVDSVKQCHP